MGRKKPKNTGNQNQQSGSKKKPQNKQKSGKQNVNSEATEAESPASPLPKSITTDNFVEQTTGTSSTVKASPSLQELSTTQQQSLPKNELPVEDSKNEQVEDVNTKGDTVASKKGKINLEVQTVASSNSESESKSTTESVLTPGSEELPTQKQLPPKHELAGDRKIEETEEVAAKETKQVSDEDEICLEFKPDANVGQKSKSESANEVIALDDNQVKAYLACTEAALSFSGMNKEILCNLAKSVWTDQLSFNVEEAKFLISQAATPEKKLKLPVVAGPLNGVNEIDITQKENKPPGASPVISQSKKVDKAVVVEKQPLNFSKFEVETLRYNCNYNRLKVAEEETNYFLKVACVNGSKSHSRVLVEPPPKIVERSPKPQSKSTNSVSTDKQQIVTDKRSEPKTLVNGSTVLADVNSVWLKQLDSQMNESLYWKRVSNHNQLEKRLNNSCSKSTKASKNSANKHSDGSSSGAETLAPKYKSTSCKRGANRDDPGAKSCRGGRTQWNRKWNHAGNGSGKDNGDQEFLTSSGNVREELRKAREIIQEALAQGNFSKSVARVDKVESGQQAMKDTLEKIQNQVQSLEERVKNLEFSCKMKN